MLHKKEISTFCIGCDILLKPYHTHILKLMQQRLPILCVHCNHKYTPEIPEFVPSLFPHGAQIGGLRVFSRNQNNRGSSGVYVTTSTAHVV